MSIQIVREYYTGCRIPISALRVVNGQAGVYVLRGSKIVFKKVEPLYEYDGYIISADKSADDASYIAKNDFIVTKGKDLYDGKIIE